MVTMYKDAGQTKAVCF